MHVLISLLHCVYLYKDTDRLQECPLRAHCVVCKEIFVAETRALTRLDSQRLQGPKNVLFIVVHLAINNNISIYLVSLIRWISQNQINDKIPSPLCTFSLDLIGISHDLKG